MCHFKDCNKHTTLQRRRAFLKWKFCQPGLAKENPKQHTSACTVRKKKKRTWAHDYKTFTQGPNCWSHSIPVWALHIFASDVMLCHVMLKEPQGERRSGLCAPSGGAAFMDLVTDWVTCFLDRSLVFLRFSHCISLHGVEAGVGCCHLVGQCDSWSGGRHLGSRVKEQRSVLCHYRCWLRGTLREREREKKKKHSAPVLKCRCSETVWSPPDQKSGKL